MEGFNILQHIDLIAVSLVILGGIFATKYFKDWGINNATKTLIFGTIFIGIYLVILHMSGQLNKADYSKYFISYAVATSLYEFIKKIIIDQIKKKTGTDLDKVLKTNNMSNWYFPLQTVTQVITEFNGESVTPSGCLTWANQNEFAEIVNNTPETYPDLVVNGFDEAPTAVISGVLMTAEVIAGTHPTSRPK